MVGLAVAVRPYLRRLHSAALRFGGYVRARSLRWLAHPPTPDRRPYASRPSYVATLLIRALRSTAAGLRAAWMVTDVPSAAGGARVMRNLSVLWSESE